MRRLLCWLGFHRWQKSSEFLWLECPDCDRMRHYTGLFPDRAPGYRQNRGQR